MVLFIAPLGRDRLSGDEYNPYERKLGRGVFLVANRNLLDPNFSQTVVLLIEYGTQGAVGLIVNRETDVRFRDVVPEKKILRKRKDNVFVGGPVGVDQLLILVRTEQGLTDSYRVTDNVYAVSSLEVLEEVLTEYGNDVEFRAYAGYAGWAPGQLEAEVARGDWFVVAADSESVFSREPESVWPHFIKRSTLQWTRLNVQADSAVSPAVEVVAIHE
jgi:putative transcriptional regulator